MGANFSSEYLKLNSAMLDVESHLFMPSIHGVKIEDLRKVESPKKIREWHRLHMKISDVFTNVLLFQISASSVDKSLKKYVKWKSKEEGEKEFKKLMDKIRDLTISMIKDARIEIRKYVEKIRREYAKWRADNYTKLCQYGIGIPAE